MANEKKLLALILLSISLLLVSIVKLDGTAGFVLTRSFPGMGQIDSLEIVKSPNDVRSHKPQPRIVLHGLREKIYESNWIEIFPNLKKMVEVVADGDRKAITNPKHTSIKLLNSDDLQVGGTLKAMITSYNEAGDSKKYGGDFFDIMLRRPGSKTDGVTCEITDHTNGSYSVSCILPWEGAAILEAKLVHPSETIYQLMKMFSSEKQKGFTLFTTMLNSTNQTEKTECTIGFPDARPGDVCDYSNPTHGEKRQCLRPPSGECSKIIHQQKVYNKETLIIPNNNWYSRAGYNFMQPISGSGLSINIGKGTDPIASYFLGNSSINLDPACPTGWRQDGKWTSMKSQRTVTLDLSSLKSCFTNKRIHIFGDSTTRNIYRYFINELQIKEFDVGSIRYKYRLFDAASEKMNLTIRSRPHGPPLGNEGPDLSRPYMSDCFDAITEGGEGTIVMLTIGYHWHYFDADAYLRRLGIIKQAAISFISRLPGSKVIVKGLHYLSHAGCIQCHWLTYQFDAILRHEFRDLENIDFVENWDFTITLNNVNIHPDKPILAGTIQLMLPYVC